MACLAKSCFSLRRAALLACAILPLAFGGAGLRPASAASGPFAEFPGRWAGTGIIRVKNSDGEHTERIRCDAAYDVRSERDINLHLTCKSDSYNFDLTGDFQADARNHVSGRWTESSRNIGGEAIGTARSNRLQLHVESSVLSGNLGMVTRSRSQTVSLDAMGSGQSVRTSITLHRSSR